MKPYQGYLYAFAAAIFNAMIGIFSVKIMATGLSPSAISFYKCLVAFLMITSWLIISKQWTDWLASLRRMWWQLLVAAFFGFFVLYFFETAAYQHEKVTIVVFMLLGSAVLTTFSLSSILNKKWLEFQDVMSCSLSIVGLALIFGVNVSLNDSYLGILLALIAGIGYGTFLTISPKLSIGSGLLVVNSLLLFGTIFLFFPFAIEGLTFIEDVDSAVLLVFLALLPTIGGFLCTTKSLTMLRSESVQLIEVSEPILSIVFSSVFLHQYMTFWQVAGGFLLIASIWINITFKAKRESGLPISS